MINCIDCFWSIQQEENHQCKKASPEIKECKGFVDAHRRIEIIKQVNEMLEG